jgi:hypothetical protein
VPDVSICPRCGARLVTRNLSHSCGTFTLEGLFPRSEPAVLDLARKYVAMLYALGDVQVIPQKTRLTCVAESGSPGFSRVRMASSPVSRCIAGWIVRGSSRPKTTDRAGDFTSYPFAVRPTWTTNSKPGFRNRTTSWECRAICEASDRPRRAAGPRSAPHHVLGLRRICR